MAEASPAPNPREMLAALIEQGQTMFTYAELDRLFAVDVRTPSGRAVFYGAQHWLLNAHRIWLKNVQSQGYKVVRDGPTIQRAARRVEQKRTLQTKAQRKYLERAKVREKAAWDAENARQVLLALRAAESDSPEETARQWVNGRRGLAPAVPSISPELPGLEFGRDAVERVTQAALAQVYREVARTLAEMAERYAVMAEQALAGMK